MNMRLLLAGAALTTLLAACDRKPETPADASSSISIASAPEQVSNGAPLDVGLAPAAPQALPAAAPAPVYDLPPTEEEAYWQEAQDYYNEYADAPPDYVYDYGEEAPAAWLNGALVRMVVERLAGGGERYYYYRGDDDRPYFVRDPDYWYGYRDGRLVSVYDYRNRRPLAREETRRRAEWAGRYAVRAEELRRAARRAENAERKPIDRGQWQSWQRRDDIRERREKRERRDRNRPSEERPREERPDQARPPVITPQPQRPLEPSPGRPDRPRDERPDRGERPDRVERPQRPETRPDRPSRPERPERPEQAQRLDRGERPQRPTERPERPERPRAETPREQPQRPERSERPRPERPAPAAKPAPQPEAKPAEARPAPKPKPERPTRERGQGERQAPDPQ